jgi:alkylhydroperoxidase family enzyme
MRLPLLPPASLSADQQDLYDDMVDVIETNFGELVARRKDGALIGPFTTVSGERPSDLTHDERVAYDMAAALNRGGPLPETTYRAVLSTFGEVALAEIVFLVGCFSMVGITLNAFDASVPGRSEGLD